ncbi:DNA cytosine methyltransferase [Corynebacterium aurimucosum]|uniref:Cytosine-specific methyltransferase n=1 Tax=Corynebacterium aurimucosum TaxID=169292 RepID=A0A558GIN9_9CORY|nr:MULTISPECIES: DNA cytosine methyltransferase [unclassified Corynebacterium]MBU5654920.1 DNA cytosine methyltransferase [Corynebacterium aurimucosum]MTE10733.1 DNA cytosine methyltransferase [Corynebacterium guaraldiae]MDK6807874.1 DNA cytosine methyltransferase [Corynebacterium aurimucosum]MDK6813667.1 DNA cytosine methyltransferase [Corynebacterium sp. UMB6689]NJJ82703.1 DNA cytosine methyltransferase [Corynebacterium aurimucosum]
MHNSLTSVEICAGAGGQALGLENAGFEHLVAVEIDEFAVQTLRVNRPHWNVVEADVLEFDPEPYVGADLFAGGVPCPPFSIAGQQLGEDDERDLFPRALEMIKQIDPRAVMLENVKGLGQKRFEEYRARIITRLEQMGYSVFWKLLQAADYGVPQLRPRFILVAVKEEYAPYFFWPPANWQWKTVGEALEILMGQNGWTGAAEWAKKANKVAPTLVGGSKKHGGPDVGPTRAKAAWKELGVKGTSIAETAPEEDFPTNLDKDLPRLTVQMGGVIQGFPQNWIWQGKKTAQWRQVGNAFPPPVAEAVGSRIAAALNKEPLPDGVYAAEPTRVPDSLRF